MATAAAEEHNQAGKTWADSEEMEAEPLRMIRGPRPQIDPEKVSVQQKGRQCGKSRTHQEWAKQMVEQSRGIRDTLYPQYIGRMEGKAAGERRYPIMNEGHHSLDASYFNSLIGEPWSIDPEKERRAKKAEERMRVWGSSHTRVAELMKSKAEIENRILADIVPYHSLYAGSFDLEMGCFRKPTPPKESLMLPRDKGINKILKERKMFYNVEIEKVNNGFIVEVGCQEFVFNNEKEMFSALSEYYKDPKAAEEKYCAKKSKESN